MKITDAYNFSWQFSRLAVPPNNVGDTAKFPSSGSSPRAFDLTATSPYCVRDSL